MLDQIPEHDIPWSNKKDAAIWRGALTGRKRDGFSILTAASQTPRERCLQMHRCRLVLSHSGSTVIDAKLVGIAADFSPLPSVIDGVELYGEKASFQDMLQYKAIIMLEGNDVSSGLKWALFSNSVVLTQPSTYTSWAMEELLEPWVHYIPLNEDLSNVEEQMQWVLENDDEARNIAHRGALWISDLIFHPQAGKDDEEIFDETFRRYMLHFVQNNNLMANLLKSS
jgi:hypothetical protein